MINDRVYLLSILVKKVSQNKGTKIILEIYFGMKYEDRLEKCYFSPVIEHKYPSLYRSKIKRLGFLLRRFCNNRDSYF